MKNHAINERTAHHSRNGLSQNVGRGSGSQSHGLYVLSISHFGNCTVSMINITATASAAMLGYTTQDGNIDNCCISKLMMKNSTKSDVQKKKTPATAV